VFGYLVVAILGVYSCYDIVRSERNKCEPTYCRLAGRRRGLSHSSGKIGWKEGKVSGSCCRKATGEGLKGR
jgi:hypothetical protein